MIRQPQRSALFPYTTLFRSSLIERPLRVPRWRRPCTDCRRSVGGPFGSRIETGRRISSPLVEEQAGRGVESGDLVIRTGSEGGRVGKGGRSRWSPDRLKKKN